MKACVLDCGNSTTITITKHGSRKAGGPAAPVIWVGREDTNTDAAFRSDWSIGLAIGLVVVS